MTITPQDFREIGNGRYGQPCNTCGQRTGTLVLALPDARGVASHTLTLNLGCDGDSAEKAKRTLCDWLRELGVNP